MGNLLVVVTVAFAIPSCLAVAYYWLLALASLLPKPRRERAEPGRFGHVFCILVPAHDEARGIAATLRSCASIAYPRDKYRVTVIADNCTDATAEVARAEGAEVLVRTDESRRGKGQALEWAFDRLVGRGCDAFVILDADCRISPNALAVLDEELERGASVLQTGNLASNPDESFLSYALGVGNLIENRFFYAPKSRLDLAVLLRGTGMVIGDDVLRRHPWRAGSLAEDVEYGFELIRARERVSFVEEASVASPFPSDPEQVRVQRERWAGGAASLGRTRALRYLVEGVTRGNPRLVDAAWTLLVISRPLVILLSSLAAASALLLRMTSDAPPASALLKLTVANLALLSLYLACGVLAAGLSARRLRFLLMAPVAIGKLAGIALRALAGGKANRWERTPR